MSSWGDSWSDSWGDSWGTLSGGVVLPSGTVDRRVYGCVESGVYRLSPTTRVELLGALSGLGIRKSFSSVLSGGSRVTVSVRSSEDVWAIYSGAIFNSENFIDLSGASLVEVSGVLPDGGAVAVYAIDPHPALFPPVFSPVISDNALELNLEGLRETYHRVTLYASIVESGITVVNAPTSGVIKILVQFLQSGGPHTVPITAWNGMTGVVFETPYQVYADSTPTIVTLLSLDGGSSWRARCNYETGNPVVAVTELPASPDPNTVYLVFEE
jgi:hypothetical protein